MLLSVYGFGFLENFTLYHTNPGRDGSQIFQQKHKPRQFLAGMRTRCKSSGASLLKLVEICRPWNFKTSAVHSVSRRLYRSVPIPLLLLNIKEKTQASVLDAKARTCSVSSHGDGLLHADNLCFGMQCSFVKKLFYFRKKKKQKSLFWAVQWSLSESFQAIQFVCWGICCHSSVVCVLGFVCVCICVCVCVKTIFSAPNSRFSKGMISLIARRSA